MAAPTLHREASATHRAEVRAEELECELTAERLEHAEFATAVHALSNDAWNNLANLRTVEQRVAQLVALSARRRRQAGGGA